MRGCLANPRTRAGARCAAVALVVCALAACNSWREDGSPGPATWWDAGDGANAEPRRISNASPWYPVDEQDLSLQASWCGWDKANQTRVEHLNIAPRAKRMIESADGCIVASVFLFDNLYPPDGVATSDRDVVAEFTELLVAKRRASPDVPVVLVLDLMHKAWSDRRSEAVARLREAGVDVFYSDRLDTHSATRLPAFESSVETWYRMDDAVGGPLGKITRTVGKAPVPFVTYKFDGEPIRLATVFNAAMFKANHRKLLVTRAGGRWEAMVTSANPHNASIPNENYSLTVAGPLAAYLYMVQRADVVRSIERGGHYCDWCTQDPAYQARFLDAQLPALAPEAYAPPVADGPDFRGPRVMCATEEAIEAGVLAMLERAGPGDEIRIQMFYLSRVPVINALLDAAHRTGRPVRLLLDSNRIGLGYPKNGTPNAQVAAYLLGRAGTEGLDLRVRWYATRGEQNHAKIMSITNPGTGKHELTTGSANWTRKNLDCINLEANLFVRDTPRVTAQFNELFDQLWDNAMPGLETSVAWDDPRFEWHDGPRRAKWAHTPRHLLIFPFRRPDGRPVLVEKQLVHW